MNLNLKNKISIDQFLFSETQSRILVSLNKNKLANFKKILSDTSLWKLPLQKVFFDGL